MTAEEIEGLPYGRNLIHAETGVVGHVLLPDVNTGRRIKGGKVRVRVVTQTSNRHDLRWWEISGLEIHNNGKHGTLHEIRQGLS